jgi:lipoprotein-releasing system ATP-binding protein
LSDPNSGEILLNNQSYLHQSQQKKEAFRNTNIGFVFQFHNLLGEFNVRENVLMPISIRNKPIQEATNEMLNEIASSLGISNLMDKYPTQLSGGEQQRVAVARALITQPSILLADEPTGNLDNKNAEVLYELFLKIKAERGQQIIMVTHNEKLTYQSDQIIFLESGKIQ